MEIKERIKQYLELKGISKYQFYKEMGFANGFLDKDGSIGSDKCEKIIYHYKDLNIEWLITGNGPMIIDSFIAKEPEPVYGEINNPFYQLYKEKDQEVNRLNQEIGALNAEVEHLKKILRQSNLATMIDQDVEAVKITSAG